MNSYINFTIKKTNFINLISSLFFHIYIYIHTYISLFTKALLYLSLSLFLNKKKYKFFRGKKKMKRCSLTKFSV